MICLDTMILIWGVQGAATSGQEEMVEKTRRYLESLQESNDQIMVPTPALAEYLQGFDLEDRRRQLEVLERHFVIPAFDLPAAFLAAGIARKAQKPAAVSRPAMKTDVQIIATAVVARARLIVTHEKDHFQALAGDRIHVSDVPVVHDQTDLDFDG